MGRGHKGFTVTGDPDMPFEEAARRRDFTINAIGWDPLTNEYIDPRGGRADLDRRVLRVVDPATFGDDSLRVLRALQLAARFDLTLDPATFELCRTIPLDDLPPERIWGEFEKLLCLARKPSIGLALARDLGVVDALVPELRPLVGCEQDVLWHPEGDVWVHTLMVVDEARTEIDELPRAGKIAVMLGALTHDLGARRFEPKHHVNHADRNRRAEQARALERRVRIRQASQAVTLLHPPGHDYYRILRSKLHWGRGDRDGKTPPA